MRKITLVLFCLLSITFSKAQQKAVTETGEEVILYDDGTWKYQNKSPSVTAEIPINPTKFKKGKQSTFLLKSKTIDMGFWLDPKKWSFEKNTSEADIEYDLQLKDGGLYSMIICEKIQIPLETLKTIAFANGQDAAPDLQIVKEEYRKVNGLDVLHLRMDGTVQGIKFSYYGYYFSNEKGTVQFITFTSQNLMEDYEKEAEQLLNGLVDLD